MPFGLKDGDFEALGEKIISVKFDEPIEKSGISDLGKDFILKCL